MTISRRAMLAASGSLSASLLLAQGRASARCGGDFAALRGSLRGALVMPEDAEYHAARLGEGATPVADRFPACIVLPETAADVAQAIAFARASDLDLSVRAGGHDILGASTTHTGMVLDLVRMNAIEIDSETGTARVGAGTRAGALVEAADSTGWAPVVGNNPHVGVAGLTLGGGMGWFTGKYGASADHLLSAQIVTADGEVLEANADSHPDLFWALRGGGGNFGVVTALTFRLRPVTSVLGGVLSYRVEPREFLRFYRDYLAQSPDDLDLAAVFATGAKPALFLKASWLGEEVDGRRALQPLLDYAEPEINTIARQSYARFANDRQVSELNRLFWRGGEYDGLSDARIDLLHRTITAREMPDCSIGVGHYMHGALCRVPFGDTPFVRTEGNLVYSVNAFWADADAPADKDRKRAWAVSCHQALQAQACERTYLNYLSSNAGDRVGKSFGPHYGRLQAIKRRYDPDNLFRNNRNIVVGSVEEMAGRGLRLWKS